MSGVGNWGRWGEDDERGALNLLDQAAVQRALAEVAQGRFLGLGLEMRSRGTPTMPLRPPLLHMMKLDGADFEAGARRAENGFQFADDWIGMAGHAGTHVDALSHVAGAGLMYNGIPATEVRSMSGARRLGIEKFEGLVARAVLLDIPAALGREPLEPGFEVGIDHLEAALDRAGTGIETGDAVLLRTGWLARFRPDDPSWYQAEPGIGVAAAAWLAERDVSLLAADNFAVEVVPAPDGAEMPVHLLCLQRHGIYLMELVDLDRLVEVGVSRCALVVAPLLIAGGVGCPVNPIAIY